jgi:IclR family transcriptional regulator, KDG regulon repressor
MTLDPHISKAVFTISKILSLFSSEKDEIGVREVSKILTESPGSIFRLLSSMQACGLLQKNINRKYQLGVELFKVGILYPIHSPLRKVVRPHAEDLAKILHTNVQLAIPSNKPTHPGIIIDRIINLDDPFYHSKPFILEVPLYCSALGKSILAFLPSGVKQEALKKLVLLRHTKNTITQKKVLKEHLKKIQKNGFSIDRGELFENVFCVSVPLFYNTKIMGALSVSDTLGRISEKNAQETAKVLMEKSSFIERQLLAVKE